MTPKELSELRHRLGFETYVAFANALQVRPETVWRWEHGKQPISHKASQKMMALAGLDLCPTCGQVVPLTAG